MSQFKCADGQSKDNGAHQLIDYLSYGGVSGREQSVVWIHLTSVVFANTNIDFATTGYQILHTRSPIAGRRWDLRDEERTRAIRSTCIRLGPEVTTVTLNESAPLEHMDSPCSAPLEQAALHLSSFHSAHRCFQRILPPTDHTWIKRETVDVLDMRFSSGYRDNCVGWAFTLNCYAVFAGILPFNWKYSSCTPPKHILDKINVF